MTTLLTNSLYELIILKIITLRLANTYLFIKNASLETFLT